MPPTDAQDKSSTVLRTVTTAAVLLCWIAGCSGTRSYTAGNLPAELHASPIVNAQTLNLTHLAGPPVNSQMINRNDLLEVTIVAGLSSEDTWTGPVRVADNGVAILPEIGPLQLAGLHITWAEQKIATASIQQGLYLQPQVTVTMEQQAENRITVSGGVNEPGVYPLPRSSSDVLAALTAAGGLAEDAGTHITIRCLATTEGDVRLAGYNEASLSSPGGRPTLVTLNMAEVVDSPGEGYYLPDGSTIRVEQRNPAPISVVGLVRKPGQYDFPTNHDLRVFGAIGLGGGISSQLANEVLVMRYHPETGELIPIKLSLSSAKKNAEENLLLAPGDIVSVEQSPATIVSDVLSRVIRFGMSASVPVF